MRSIGLGYITMSVMSVALGLASATLALVDGSLPGRLLIAHRWLALYLLPWAGVAALALALSGELLPRRVFVALSGGSLTVYALWMLLGLLPMPGLVVLRVLSWTKIACTIGLIAWSIAALRREGGSAGGGRRAVVACGAFGVALVIALMFVPWPRSRDAVGAVLSAVVPATTPTSS